MIGIHSSHLPILKNYNRRHNIYNAIKQDVENLNINAVQIFTHGPQNTKRNNIDISAINNFCEKYFVHLIIHSSYILGNTIWEVNKTTLLGNESEKYKRYLIHFVDQVNISQKLKNAPIVIHLPRYPMKDILDTVEIMSKNIKKDSLILFENVPCKSGGYEYSSAKSLNDFVKRVAIYLPKKNWGLCIDTAHIWSCGIDLSSFKSQEKWFAELDDLTKSMIRQIHLNGSKKKTFNTNRDIHYVALTKADDLYHFEQDEKKNIGHVNSKNDDELRNSGVWSLCKFAKKNKIPIICEIHPDRDCTDNEIVKSLDLIKHILKHV